MLQQPGAQHAMAFEATKWKLDPFAKSRRPFGPVLLKSLRFFTGFVLDCRNCACATRRHHRRQGDHSHRTNRSSFARGILDWSRKVERRNHRSHSRLGSKCDAERRQESPIRNHRQRHLECTGTQPPYLLLGGRETRRRSRRYSGRRDSLGGIGLTQSAASGPKCNSKSMMLN